MPQGDVDQRARQTTLTELVVDLGAKAIELAGELVGALPATFAEESRRPLEVGLGDGVCGAVSRLDAGLEVDLHELERLERRRSEVEALLELLGQRERAAAGRGAAGVEPHRDRAVASRPFLGRLEVERGLLDPVVGETVARVVAWRRVIGANDEPVAQRPTQESRASLLVHPSRRCDLGERAFATETGHGGEQLAHLVRVVTEPVQHQVGGLLARLRTLDRPDVPGPPDTFRVEAQQVPPVERLDVLPQVERVASGLAREHRGEIGFGRLARDEAVEQQALDVGDPQAVERNPLVGALLEEAHRLCEGALRADLVTAPCEDEERAPERLVVE